MDSNSCPQPAIKKPPVIFLMGPTASGKTDLAIALAQRYPIDVISVDSALVYRGMNIGTAKPSTEELAQAPHALIDICDPSESYSVADFCRDAQALIQQSHQAKRIPLLVGGTMMYFNALVKGLADMPATDGETRLVIEQEAEIKGWPAMHALLAAVDPDTAAQIHPNHSHRIARALAVYRMSGKTMSAYRADQVEQQSNECLSSVSKPWVSSPLAEKYTLQQFALVPEDRLWLHERIKTRFQKMLEVGLVDEVSALYQRADLTIDLPSMRSVGYRQVWQMLAGEYNHETMVDKGVAATRQLAKRQLTWLRGWENLQTLSVNTKMSSVDYNAHINLDESVKF